MQLRNNYETEVFNGDIGRVARVDPEEGTLAVRFEDREVPYEAADLNELILAYAVSVHKSQGSEYPAVLLPLHTQHFIMLRRNLLYTAITRGRRLDVLAGSRRALAIAVKTAPAEGRYTRLAARLRAAAQRREA
jgi:exodeoxyribonuclease V alpha subunit